MSKKDTKKNLSTEGYDDLTIEQIEELKKLTIQITEEAKLLVEEYANNPSDASGSLVIVHQDSPLLDTEVIVDKDTGQRVVSISNKDKDNNNDSE